MAEMAAGGGRIVVVDRGFCVTYPINILMKHKGGLFSKTHFEIFDANEKPLFQIRGNVLGLHQKRILYDASDSPILTMRDKAVSSHQRWTVYRGDSIEKEDAIFRVKDSKYWQTKPNMDVFFASNDNEDNCDFHLEGRNSNMSCTVYKGDTVIAEVKNEFTWAGALLAKDSMLISVNAAVDFAFITSLVAIHYKKKLAQASATATAGGVTGGAVAVS